MNILQLTLKKKWFDMILSGEKTEEYRECKLYWRNRLHPINKISGGRNDDVFRHFDIVRFTNGYGPKAPTFDVECKGIRIGNDGKPEWGFRGQCFIISLGNIITNINK